MNPSQALPLNQQEQPNVSDIYFSARLWAAIVLTGAGAGLSGGCLMRLLRWTQHLSYCYGSGDFLSGVEQTSGTRRVAVMFAAGVAATVVLTLMKRAGMVSGGSLSLAVWNKSGRMPAMPKLMRGLLSIVAVGMGASLGREGALKDTGGVIANGLSDLFAATAEQRRLLVACGAGAGMAAAYNVPLGGALFAAEVLLGSLTLSSVVPALAASVTGVACSWLLLPNEPAYRISSVHVSSRLIFWAVLAGPLLGLLSVGWVRAIAWARGLKLSAWQTGVLPIVIFTLIGFVAIRFPEILGNGKNVVQLTFFDQVGIGLLCWLIVLKPLATVLCLGTGTPGGMFTPTMTVGALVGDGLGRFWNHYGTVNAIAAYALIGSAGFLAAATLGPVSSAVFVLELTRGAEPLMVPLLIATAGATVTARRFGTESIYTD